MARYEYFINGEYFDEVTPEIIDRYYADEFDNYLDDEVGTASDLVNMAAKSSCTVEDVIRDCMWDFARMIEENPYGYYLNVHEVED